MSVATWHWPQWFVLVWLIGFAIPLIGWGQNVASRLIGIWFPGVLLIALWMGGFFG